MWRRRVPALAALLVLSACGADVGTSAATSADGTPPPSEAAAAPSAAESPRELPSTGGLTLKAGSYSLGDFPVGITFEIPAFEPPEEWFACSPSPVEQSVCYSSTLDEDVPVSAVAFMIVDNVVADPCADQETAELLDPPVGTSVAELVTAISSLEGFEATAPMAISVSGFPAVEFTLTAPDTEGCSATWATAQRTTGMGPGETNLLRLLDVDGVRVVMSAAYHRVTPEADVAAVKQVLDSVQIQP